ncbi:kinase-like domain-containing protein [Phyllosticta capitalensis]
MQMRWPTKKILSFGGSGLIHQVSEERVIKVPKLQENNSEIQKFHNDSIRHQFRNEAPVLERIGSHPHIIQFFGILKTGDEVDEIELAFANQGDLQDWFLKKEPPALELKKQWIRSLADAYNHLHSRRVFYGDYNICNILVHNETIKMCDFGQSDLLPLDTDMSSWKSESGETAQEEMLNLGYIFYSIAIWKETRYDWYETKTFPKVEDLPSLDGIPFATVIRKCWTGAYRSMQELKDEVFATA